MDIRGTYDFVLTILGTNDVPKVTARQKTWDTYEELIASMVTSLKLYLKPGENTQALIITQPFNFEPDRAVTLFNELLQRCARAANVSFQVLPWDRELHSQSEKNTRTPLKNFNICRINMLSNLVAKRMEEHRPRAPEDSRCAEPELSTPKMSEAAVSVSQNGASSTLNASSRIPSGGWKAPKPPSSSDSDSSSTSSSSSSGSMHGTKKGNGPAGASLGPSGRQTTTPLTSGSAPSCELCLTRGHHKSEDCPLVWGAAYGEHVEAAKVVAKLVKNTVRSTPHGNQIGHAYPGAV